MTRRRFLAALQLPPRPNIIFILADDLGWGDLSCYGNRQIKTPHLDRLASQGSLFTQFYVCGSVCSPSRTAFTTGQFPARHRIHGHLSTEADNLRRGMPNFLDPAVPTLARLLQKSGYATAHFGKWHLGRFTGAPLPTAYGFDVQRSIASNDDRQEELAKGYRAQSSRVIVDDGLRFLDALPAAKPFYLQLWMLLPHAPLDPTEEQLSEFASHAPHPATVTQRGAHQTYFASLRDLDNQLGRLFAELDRRNLAENTIILFSSDNGPEDIHIRNASHSAFGTPGPLRGRKRSLYDGGIRVPLIARWPGKIPAARVSPAVVCGADFLPTLTKLANVPYPANLDGEDRSAVLLGANTPRRNPLFWEWRFNVAGYSPNRSPILAIRDGDWKLLMNPDRSRLELFDMVRDPSELHDLAPLQPQVVERLATRLLAWQKTLPAGPIEPSAGRNDWPMPQPTK